MNNVQLIGRITRELDLNRTTNDTPVCSFTLAVDRRKKDAGADFIRCKAWNRSAEVICSYLGKGDPIAINGHIETGSYEKDGRTVYTTEVVVDSFDFIGGKKGAGSGYDTPQAVAVKPDKQDFFAVDDDYDLPF